MNFDSPVSRLSPLASLGSARAAVALACLLLPWLNPFAPGPSAAVGPYLVSVACVVVLWITLAAPARPEGPAQAALVAAGWAAAAVVSSVIALCQYFGLADLFSPWMNATPVGEAYANLRQRNQFASLAMIGLAASLWWARPGASRAAWVLLICLLAVGSAVSASRTGLLQLALLIGLQALWPEPGRTYRLKLCLLAVLVYLAAASLLPRILESTLGVQAPQIWGRFLASEGCSSRMVLWGNVLHLIAERPWTGWGFGQLDYAHYITLYPGTRFCDILDNAHNLPLHLAVELGLPAAAAILATMVVLIVRARPWGERDPNRQLAWTVLALIGLHSLLEYPLWYGPFELAAGLCIWLLWWPRGGPADSDRPAGPDRRSLRHALAALLLAATAYAGWDYQRISQIYKPVEARSAGYREDTIEKIRSSWLFRDQVRFAELTITELTRNNAQWTFDTAQDLLRYSPEPRVIEKLIEAAVMLGRDHDALMHLARYRNAFQQDYQRWRARTMGIGSATATDARSG